MADGTGLCSRSRIGQDVDHDFRGLGMRACWILTAARVAAACLAATVALWLPAKALATSRSAAENVRGPERPVRQEGRGRPAAEARLPDHRREHRLWPPDGDQRALP